MDKNEIYNHLVNIYERKSKTYNNEIDLGIQLYFEGRSEATCELRREVAEAVVWAYAKFERYKEDKLKAQMEIAAKISAAHSKDMHNPGTAGTGSTAHITETNGGKSLDNIAASKTNQ